MAKSFISEHSAEYILVPQFASILAATFNNIIPVFFWSSREGGNLSKESFQNTFVRVVALYPRRPKVESIEQPYIEVKFNDRLSVRVAHLYKNNIPVFAGVPVINSLAGFHLNADCAWFSLKRFTREEILKIPIDGAASTSNQIKQVNKSEILNIVHSICKPMRWSLAIDFLKQKRLSFTGEYFRYGFWGEVYKPVYFLLPEA